ncbi:hypothetical protein IFR04_001811 [Cadophora malorum]|uniref:Uncharacterized protein n=1 Tax=Cadophora malorum TaxID=108018 RepID=A0A8H7WHY0_9HELO|nr:hypothetical protein IFR04_001811 [Cadophora malorum]
MSYLRLASALKTVTQKASHPSALIYKVQLAHVKQQQLNGGEIGDGKTGVVELMAPEEVKADQQAGEKALEGLAESGRREDEVESAPIDSKDGI